MFFSRLAPAALLGAALLAPECPTQPSPTHFPEGSYYFQSAYVFSFRDYPYYITFAGFANGAGATGDYTGEYIVVAWYTQAAYQNGLDPSCYIYEDLTATHDDGRDPDINYASCEGCDPISDFYTRYREDTGCQKALLDLWYFDEETGEYDYEWEQMAGYRHAETDGWPAEFADSAASWEEAGYEGVLYDLLLGNTGYDFAANYFVRPEETGARWQAAPMSRLIELESIHDLRGLMGR